LDRILLWKRNPGLSPGFCVLKILTEKSFFILFKNDAKLQQIVNAPPYAQSINLVDFFSTAFISE